MTIAVRAVCLGLGIAACCWSISGLPGFIATNGLQSLADRIVNSEPYQIESLLALKPELAAIEQAPFCRGSDVRSAAIIRFRLAQETLLAGQRQQIEDDLNALRGSLRSALACAPGDSFLWLAMYWVTLNLDGFGDKPLTYLRMSYQQGPREGWIALKRNPDALAIFDALPPDLQQAATEEYLGIVRSGFFDPAVNILTGPGWHVKDKLLAAIATLPLRLRERLDRQLRARQFEIDIEGVPPPKPKAFL